MEFHESNVRYGDIKRLRIEDRRYSGKDLGSSNFNKEDKIVIRDILKAGIHLE